jgi:phosphoglycerol transferase MdoB-like AlkP superfamily enzyme
VLKKKAGYFATAIHNHEGKFYDREKIYSLLGFDNFIPVESMENVEYSKNWPKDYVLLKYIQKTLEATPSRDFIFTVTVGTHSSYDYEYDNTTSKIKVSGNAEERALNQISDYINRLEEADKFVGDLIEYIHKSKEPIVLVVYGDHIPALDVITFDKDYVKSQVPYFIVSNYKLRGKTESVMPTYRLYTQVLNTTGLKKGMIASFHNAFKEDIDYYKKLDLAGYDMLFGSKYMTSGKDIYELSQLKLGIPSNK